MNESMSWLKNWVSLYCKNRFFTGPQELVPACWGSNKTVPSSSLIETKIPSSSKLVLVVKVFIAFKLFLSLSTYNYWGEPVYLNPRKLHLWTSEKAPCVFGHLSDILKQAGHKENLMRGKAANFCNSSDMSCATFLAWCAALECWKQEWR